MLSKYNKHFSSIIEILQSHPNSLPQFFVIYICAK